MYNKIFKKIKSYNNIVVARHVGVDPDAMASQIALRDSIRLTFPEKHVYAIGNGSVKFNFMGNLDRGMNFDAMDEILLIVVDTPDKKRVDMEDLTHYEASVKIDHHPFMEKFCDIEVIDDKNRIWIFICNECNAKYNVDSETGEIILLETKDMIKEASDDNLSQDIELLNKTLFIEEMEKRGASFLSSTTSSFPRPHPSCMAFPFAISSPFSAYSSGLSRLASFFVKRQKAYSGLSEFSVRTVMYLGVSPVLRMTLLQKSD